jgi:hypothetical protein
MLMPITCPLGASRSWPWTAFQVHAGPAGDVPDHELTDQLRLIEAVTLTLGREVGQSMPAVVNGFTVTEKPYGSAMSKGALWVLRSSIDPPGRTTHSGSRS